LLKKFFFLIAAANLGLLAGCSSTPVKSVQGLFESKAGKTLAMGIDEYVDGKYPEASKNLQAALDLGLNPGDQVKAHKYLAFINCVTGKERLCREEFKKALDINPDMELEAAEAGHPIWGPVFKSVKIKKPAKK